MAILGSIIKKAIELKGRRPKEPGKIDPFGTQEKTLKKLIKKATPTAFGEYYSFDSILKEKDIVSEFQKSVPTHDYNKIFKKWWYRSLNGEPFVAWPGKVKYFALSSGTSEASSKHIPVTMDMFRAIKRISIRQMFSFAKYNFPREFFNKGILMLGGSTHLQFNGTYYEGDLSGITTGNIPFWFQHFYKPGKRISKERDWPTKLEEIVKKAKDWDIGIIVGVPAWLQILLEKIIEHYKLDNIHQIWPNLSIYVHGGVSFAPYKKGFQKLLGKELTYIETYLASEGFIAYQSRPNTEAMELVLDNGIFMEFVPFNEKNFDTEGNLMQNPEALTIKEVEVGKEYALLLTSCAGAWRYLIGDTIKFTDLQHNEIVITGRTKHFLNLCGEHLSQENMNRAVNLLEEELNVDVREFTVCGIKHGSMFAHKWYLGTTDKIDSKLAAEKIDSYLKTLNDDYRVERIEAIRDVIVEILPLELFYDWLRKYRKEGAQVKFPRVIKQNQKVEWEKFIEEYMKENA
jgi:hypothetical protein